MRPHVTATLFVALFSFQPLLGAEDAQPLTEAWQSSLLQLYDDAYRSFESGAQAEPADLREWRLGQAITLLNLQPRTEANVDRSEKLLAALAAENPGDPIGIVSRYYLGRIAQVHRLTPAPEAALAIYQDLLDDHPDALFAQYGGVKWAITYLGTAPTAESRLERLTEIDAMAARFNLPGPAKDLHLFLADSFMRFAQDTEKSMQHLIEAAGLGIRKRSTRGSVYVQIGEMARILGENGLALEYYRLFLTEFPRDLRTYTVTRIVNEMEEAP